MTQIIFAPLINVNDDIMTLVEWTPQSGEEVRSGEVIAVIETAKSTAELESNGRGYFRPLVEPGSEIRVGQPIAALTEQPGDPVDVPAFQPADNELAGEEAEERSWTRKAEILARRHGLDISDLALTPSEGGRLREADLLRYLESHRPVGGADKPVVEASADGPASKGVERVVVVGAGGAGAQILDVLSRVEHQLAVGLLDDDPSLEGGEIYGIPVLGPIDEAAGLLSQGLFDAVVVSIGTRTGLRAEIFERLLGAGVPFTNVIDPRAAVLSDVRMGVGNAVMPFVQIAASTVIGSNNFFSAFVDIEHHNRVGDHCTFGPGVMTSGGVRIGNRVKFGAGVFVEPLLSIGSGSVVATGAALTRSVPERSIVKTRNNFVVRKKES